MGNSLLVTQAGINRLRSDGHVFTGAVEMHPTVVELGAGTATVVDCGIDRTATSRDRDGRGAEPARH